jgi:RES domain-containing protein
MDVYRISRKKYASPLTGTGAALKGARWNSPGTEMIYTACNRSLAMAEVAVHLTIATMPDDFVIISIHIPEKVSLANLDETLLPVNWSVFPHPASTQRIGDQFVMESRCCILRVPSVITEGDYNYLINPHHPDFQHISIREIRQFRFHHRLIR